MSLFSASPNAFRRMAGAALLLALLVVMLGAYVRLSDAGLGCPDWPGCYGKAVVPGATTLYPERPLVAHKAWKEMIHRYAAGTLGLLILGLFLMTRQKPALAWARPYTSGLLLLVIFQSLLGMWTVTLKLHPLVVMGHLLGGLSVTALLLVAWLGPRERRLPTGPGVVVWGRLALIVVVLQITLGGWTSANYATTSCPDFPTCQGSWWPPMNFADAVWPSAPPSAGDYEGGTLAGDSRTAIHFTHRLGAVLTLLVVGGLAYQLLRMRGAARIGGVWLGGMLVLQFGLGVANIWLHFPLGVAVAHNGGAALLLLSLVAANLHLKPMRESEFAIAPPLPGIRPDRP